MLQGGDATDVSIGGDGSAWILDAYGAEEKVKIMKEIYLLDAIQSY